MLSVVVVVVGPTTEISKIPETCHLLYTRQPLPNMLLQSGGAQDKADVAITPPSSASSQNLAAH